MDPPNPTGAICPVACQSHSRRLAVGWDTASAGTPFTSLPSFCPWALCFLSPGLFPPFIGASPPQLPGKVCQEDKFSAASQTWRLPRWHSGFDPWVGKIPWRRKWQPTPVFWPGEFHGQKSLVDIVHGVTESDMTEHMHFNNSAYLKTSFTLTGLIVWRSTEF